MGSLQDSWEENEEKTAKDKKVIEASIDSLERNINNFPTYFKNEVVIKNTDGDQRTYVYIGEANNLSIEIDDVRGGATLTKFERVEKQTSKICFFLFIPYKIKKVKKTKDIKIWRITTGYTYSYFISNGKTSDYGYHNDLRKAVSDLGTSPQKALIDLVFKPIDEKILRAFQNQKQNKKY